MKGFTIGIDPGLVDTGISVLHFKTDPVSVKPIALYRVNTKPSKNKRKRRSTDTRDRLETIFFDTREIVRSCIGPSFAKVLFGIEYPLSGTKNSKTMAAYATLLSMAWITGARSLVFEFVPQDLKRWATGKPTGTKEQIKEVLIEKFPKLEELLNEFPPGQHEHLCDATVCGILAAHEAARGERSEL